MSSDKSVKKYILGRAVSSIIICIFCLATDLCSKAYSTYYYEEVSKDMVPWIKNVLYFNYLHNYGAAFSMLTGKTWLLLIITAVFLILMAIVLIRMPLKKRFTPLFICISFLMWGAVGNLIDRVFLGYVRDFIYFSPINFPVFNVADMFVTVSVFVIIILILFYYKDDELNQIKDRIMPKRINGSK